MAGSGERMNLTEHGLCYIATAYSRYEGGIERAYQVACQVTAELLKMGVAAFSPIAHSHGIAIHGGINPLDVGFWLNVDKAMMDAADTLIVVMMAGWRDSHGIGVEIDAFTKAGKPVIYLDPETYTAAEAPWELQEF